MTDVAIRLMAEAVRPALSQPIVIENRPGASGTIGVEYKSDAAVMRREERAA